MGVQVVKDLFKVTQVVAEAKTQVMVDGTVTVPNGKPDILKVLSVDAKLNTADIETEVIEDKVIIEGSIDVKVMYVADVAEGDQPVHVMEGSISFSNFIKVPGAKPDMDVRVNAEIEYVQFDVDSPRIADVRIVLQLSAKVTESVQVEIVTDATGPEDLQVLKETLKLEDVIGEDYNQTIVKDDITVPEGKPDIEEIIKVDFAVEEKEVKVIEDKVIVDGTFRVNVLYVGVAPEGEPQQPVHFMEATVPFTTFVEVPGAEPDMSVFTRFEVEAARGRRKDARTVTVEAVLQTFAKVTQTQEIEVVVDAYSPSEELEVEKKLLKVAQVIGEDEAQVVVKDVLSIPQEKPDIEEIYNVKASVSIDETSLIANKAIIEGTIDIETLYVADVAETEPQQPLHFTEGEISFTQFVEIPGAEEDMDLEVHAEVEHVGFSRKGPREYEVTVVVALFAKVTETVEIEVVTDIIEIEVAPGEKPPEEKEKPSMTIYIVQRGDSLWKIAKRYNTTIDAIVKANNIKDPDKILPGQQLIIPRAM
ncbi:MAG: hypothetical protein PWQ82_377 [Thermosediminibacterales bacterium]|nr:hypothetical protein [Thermosediminibacterales bacterium]MDK2836678.1 hypothetical protein [Thermosediminibacterales bacterium]